VPSTKTKKEADLIQLDIREMKCCDKGIILRVSRIASQLIVSNTIKRIPTVHTKHTSLGGPNPPKSISSAKRILSEMTLSFINEMGLKSEFMDHVCA